MTPRTSVLFAATILSGRLLLPCPALAEDPAEEAVSSLATITVTAEKLILPTRQARETVYTGSEITAKGLEIQGVRASSSVYQALGILPGINAEGADSNGLAAEMNSVRIRGVRSSLGALTVVGVPNYGGNPIGPRDYLYDLENMEGVAVYKGAVPGDIGTGVGSRGGAVELKPEWPREELALRFGQTFGGNAYSRTFLRVDSGSLTASDSRLSGSVSYTDADKWRGPGKLGPRRNVNLAASQPLGERTSLRLWLNHNDLDQHLYRPLSAAEIQELKENNRKDYNASLTGVPAQDINYYDYNRGTYQNDDLLVAMSVAALPWLDLSLKPYYSREDTEILQGVATGGGRVQKRTRDIERLGLIGEAGVEAAGLKAVVGHHVERADMHIFTQNYAITGTGLDYRGYGVTGSSEPGCINSPYLKLAGSRPWLDWQAGLKYFHYREGASQGYITGPAPDYALLRAADLDRSGKTYDIWLPTVGVSSSFSEELQVYGSYGRNFIRPYSYLPLVNLYNSNRTAFLAQSITLQDLFNGYDMEESDTVDLGLRYTGKRFEVAPTLYYARHRNLLTTIHDPRVNLNYQQNIGKASGYGIDLEMNAFFGKELTIFCNPTYTRLTYDRDLTYAGTTLAAKGNQVVDTPLWLVKTGLVYQPGNFELVPMLRYLGSRYTNKGEVAGAALVDVRMSYTIPGIRPFAEMKISLELNNLFNKKYISVINASDDAREGVATFHPGAPFSAMLGINLIH